MPFQPWPAVYFFFELLQLFPKPRLGQKHRFRRLFACGSLAVGGIELAHVACHALFDLLLAALDLALREVVVATVDGLELAAVDGNAGLRQQAHLAAQLDELRANLLDRCAAVLAEVGDGFVIRREPSGQPHHLKTGVAAFVIGGEELFSLDHDKRLNRKEAMLCTADDLPDLAKSIATITDPASRQIDSINPSSSA